MGGKNSVPSSSNSEKTDHSNPILEAIKSSSSNSTQNRNLRGALLNKMGFVGNGLGGSTVRDFKVPK